MLEVRLSGRKGSLTLLSSIRTIIGSLIRALCEILMAASSQHQSFSSSNYVQPSVQHTATQHKTLPYSIRNNYAQIQKSQQDGMGRPVSVPSLSRPVPGCSNTLPHDFAVFLQDSLRLHLQYGDALFGWNGCLTFHSCHHDFSLVRVLRLSLSRKGAKT